MLTKEELPKNLLWRGYPNPHLALTYEAGQPQILGRTTAFCYCLGRETGRSTHLWSTSFSPQCFRVAPLIPSQTGSQEAKGEKPHPGPWKADLVSQVHGPFWNSTAGCFHTLMETQRAFLQPFPLMYSWQPRPTPQGGSWAQQGASLHRDFSSTKESIPFKRN
jgi:hypothetical protein